MMRSDWRVAAVAAALMTIAVACGGHGTDTLGGDNDDGGEEPNPSESPQPGGQPALIEFVIPSDGEAPASDGSTVFQPSIGLIGSSGPLGSLIRFRVLNAQGKPARNDLRVLFSIQGPPDATLTQTKSNTVNGFVETVLRAGATRGPAVVIAQVFETNLVARSAVVTIGDSGGPAAGIEFFGLRIPGLIGSADDEAGTPQERTQLGVRGSGFQQAVDVVFAVLDDRGGAATDGTVIDFSLFGPNGGEFIAPTISFSSKGFVRATVNTGTRPGPVEITAQIRGTTLRARAIPITIGTALNPSATNMSIAADCLNVAGSVTFGLEDEIRIGLSDQFGNEIPIGSAVSFFTEGGAILAQGISDDGLKAVGNLVTQLPIPADRRVNVMGITTGQETFTDLNGNNTFDPGEPFLDMPPEVFLDANENGVYNLGEFFLDQNNNGVYDATPNQLWDDQILISVQGTVVFSGRTQIDVIPDDFTLEPGQAQEFTLLLSDDIGSALVGGTTVTLTGEGVTVIPKTPFTIPDSNQNTLSGPVEGLTQFTITVINPSPPATGGAELVPTPATVTISVDSDFSDGTRCPGGNGSVSTTIVGTVLKPVTVATPVPTATPAP